MGRKNPKQDPERMKEATEPDPELSPGAPGEEKGDSSSRVEQSKEPSEDPEKRRVAEKFQELEEKEGT